MTTHALMSRLLLAALCLLPLSLPADEPARNGVADAPAAPVAAVPATTNVVMHTALGDITLAIEVERAPLTAANFLRYVDGKRLDGGSVYRAVKIGDSGQYGMVQAGIRGNPKKVLPPIAHEPTTQTGLSHVSGAVSMARFAPGSAQVEFFIVLGALPNLDAHPDAPGDNAGYAVFGRVIDGMDIIRQMLELPRAETAASEAMKGQMLAEPVAVSSVRRASE